MGWSDVNVPFCFAAETSDASISPTGFDQSQYIALLSVWLETRYRPQSLRESIVTKLSILTAKSLRQIEADLLRGWSLNIRQCVDDFKSTGIEVIEQLELVLDTLDDLLVH